MKGLIFGGACVRREICVSKSIGLACSGEEIYHFCFVFTLYSRANSKYTPPGCTYIRRGDLTEGFLRYEFGRLIFGGACTWRGLFSEFCTVACRDKTLPRIQNMPQITKRFPEIQKNAADTKHVPEFKSILQNLKILPRNQILGHGLDSGVRFVLTRHHTFGL